MEDLKKKRKRGQIGAVYAFVIAVISIGVALVVGAVLLGQLDTINTNNLGNNANAGAMIDNIFALLSTTQGVVVLVIVVGLLGLALAYLVSSLGGTRGGR